MRRVVIVLAFACGILAVSAGSAMADDTITPGPSSQPGDPFGGQTVPPGPVIVITPGVGGSQLPAPSDPSDAVAQIEHDKQTNGVATPSASTSTPGAAATEDQPTPGSPSPQPSSAEPDKSDASSGSPWWAVGVATLALVVLAVVLLLAGRRRRDREGSDSLNDHAS